MMKDDSCLVNQLAEGKAPNLGTKLNPPALLEFGTIAQDLVEMKECVRCEIEANRCVEVTCRSLL